VALQVSAFRWDADALTAVLSTPEALRGGVLSWMYFLMGLLLPGGNGVFTSSSSSLSSFSTSCSMLFLLISGINMYAEEKKSARST
jgi:hypothetical protein